MMNSKSINGNKTSRGLSPKCNRKTCTHCLAGDSGHFWKSNHLSRHHCFFLKPNDPNMLCECCMGVFRTHSFTRVGYWRMMLVMTSDSDNYHVRLGLKRVLAVGAMPPQRQKRKKSYLRVFFHHSSFIAKRSSKDVNIPFASEKVDRKARIAMGEVISGSQPLKWWWSSQLYMLCYLSSSETHC